MVDLCCSMLVTIVSGLVSFFGANEEGGHRFNSFRGQLAVIQEKAFAILLAHHLANVCIFLSNKRLDG